MQDNIKWSQEEEIKLAKLIKNKVSLDVVSKQLNRSIKSIELRLQKIIYENMSGGKSVDHVSKLLNMAESEVLRKYNLYREYKDKNTAHEHLNKLKHNQQGGFQQNSLPISHFQYQMNQNMNHMNEIQHMNENMINERNSGGAIKNIDQKMDKIKRENEFIKLLLENKVLHQRLNELISKKKIDKNIMDVIKEMRR